MRGAQESTGGAYVGYVKARRLSATKQVSLFHSACKESINQGKSNSARSRSQEDSFDNLCKTVVVGGKMGKSLRLARPRAASGLIQSACVTSSERVNGVCLPGSEAI